MTIELFHSMNSYAKPIRLLLSDGVLIEILIKEKSKVYEVRFQIRKKNYNNLLISEELLLIRKEEIVENSPYKIERNRFKIHFYKNTTSHFYYCRVYYKSSLKEGLYIDENKELKLKALYFNKSYNNTYINIKQSYNLYDLPECRFFRTESHKRFYIIPNGYIYIYKKYTGNTYKPVKYLLAYYDYYLIMIEPTEYLSPIWDKIGIQLHNYPYPAFKYRPSMTLDTSNFKIINPEVDNPKDYLYIPNE